MNLDLLSEVGQQAVRKIWQEVGWLHDRTVTKYQVIHYRLELTRAFPNIQDWFRCRDSHMYDLTEDERQVVHEVQHLNRMLATGQWRETPTYSNRDYHWRVDYCHLHPNTKECNCVKEVS